MIQRGKDTLLRGTYLNASKVQARHQASSLSLAKNAKLLGTQKTPTLGVTINNN